MATIITKNSSTASAVPAAGDLVKGELAVNVTDKKVYTKDNSAAVVKLVGSLGNQEASAVAITGGSVTGITDLAVADGGTGASTASGARTNLGLVIGTDVPSPTGTGASGTWGISITGNAATATNGVVTTGTYADPAWITSLAGSKITGNISGNAANVTGTVAIANGGTGITAFGTGVQTALGQNVTGSGGIVLASSPSLTTPNLGTPSAATLTNATGLPIATGVSGLGTGVATALAVNTGSSGAFVVNGGALGTPSSGTLTNATGLPVSTGVSGLGTGVATALAVNTGSSGAFVVNGGALGTPSSGTLTNATGLPLSTGVTGTLAVANGGTGQTSYTDGQLLIGNTATGSLSKATLTAGTNVTITNGNGTITIAASGGGSTSPGGSNTQVQYNNAGVFAGSANMTFDGTSLTLGGNPTLSAGTANGVAYLNGSKVLTTGSALTFDGGNLGIGTSSPAAKLQVTAATASGTSGSDGARFNAGGNVAINIGADSNTGYGWIQSANWGSGYINTAINPNGGNVGIGTSSPGYKLSVNGASSGAVANIGYNGDTGTGLYVGVNHASNLVQLYASGSANKSMAFYTGATEVMRYDASGSLGIGTSSPGVRLDVAGSARFYSDGANVDVSINRQNNGIYNPTLTLWSAYSATVPSQRWGIDSNGAYYSYLSILRFLDSSASNAERARFTGSGDLLVGTTSAGAGIGWSSRLAVDGSGTFGMVIKSNNANNECVDSWNSATSGTRYHIYFRDGAGATARGSITTDGANTAYNTSSDYRLKDNQQPLTGSGAFIDALKPKTWTWKETGASGVGFIAHEVQEVSPGSVTGTKDAVDEEGKPVYQAMEYGSAEFIANIIAELQSLRARVAQLEAK